ncbi:unnamed protein product [Coffea canephora]|uniref:DH200=94 genomic scaffold, scaffold_290 n=1 Tax=Coffea canephora TaxID=49390 RepID=A0A068VE49_COFCA|nr:unnamed protein product [Coffea canephora]
MIMIGGKHPMKITYDVRFKSNGKVTALHLHILINAELSAEFSPNMPLTVISTLKRYNWGALSFDIKVCKTNHSSKSVMRGPGEVQGSYIAEAIIEEIASVLLMEVDSVRNINLHTFESLNVSIGCNGIENLVEKVRVIQSDTLSLIQGGLTAGSMTSESSCEVVRLCCNILVERLAQLKSKLQEQMVISQKKLVYFLKLCYAHSQSVNMATNSYFVPESDVVHYLNYGAAGKTKILQSNIIYDSGQSMNPAVDLGQVKGSFVQGIGFFMLEKFLINADGLTITDGTWAYKIPTIDTIPMQLNIEMLNNKNESKNLLRMEPPLLLAVSVHCATKAAIKEAKKQLNTYSGVDGTDSAFQLDVPAIMPIVISLCGLDNVERYLESLLH